MPDHLVQGMVPQLTPEQSLHLVHVVLGRCWGSLLLCGMGTVSFSMSPPNTPLPSPEKPLLHVLVVTYRLLCCLQVLRGQRGSWEFSDWSPLSALSLLS